jgi:F-box/WD-40 domain protein MET30
MAADSLRVVSGAEDRMIKIWDPRSGACEKTLYGHGGPVTCVALSGDLLVTGSEDTEVRILEFGTD